MDELSEAIAAFRSLDEWGTRAREGIQAIVKKYAKPVGGKAAPKAPTAAPTAAPKGTPKTAPKAAPLAVPKAPAHPVTSLARRPLASAPCPKGTTRIGAHCHGDTGRTKKLRKPRKPKAKKPVATAAPAAPMGVTRKLVDPFAQAAQPKTATPGAAKPKAVIPKVASGGHRTLSRRPLASVGSISRVGGAKKAKMAFVAPTRKAANRKPVGAHPITGAPHDRYSALLARHRKRKGGSARVSGKVAV